MPTMYDSVNPAALPSTGDAYAGYVGGHWPDFAAEMHRFPGKPILSIAVNAGEDAACLDVETGDASPNEAPAWYHRQVARGIHKPFLYANVSTAAILIPTLERAGIPRQDYWLWTAHYTYHPHIEPGSDATQWSDHTPPGCDCSEISPAFLTAIAGHPVPTSPTGHPTPAFPPFPGRILKQPPVMSGQDVRTWQAQMAHRGWHITIDGSYGPASQEICRQFQSEKHLAVDGEVGPATWNASWQSPIT